MPSNKLIDLKRIGITLGVILAVGTSILYYYTRYIENKRISEIKSYHESCYSPKDLHVDLNYRSDPSHLLENYRKWHNIPFDSRIRLAYEYTLNLGSKIFLKTEEPKAKVEVTAQDDGWQVKAACQPQKIDFEDILPGELPDLAMASFSQRVMLEKFVKQQSQPAVNHANTFAEADRLMQEFNTIAIVDALRKLDNSLAGQERNPELFFRASRCYVWLAMLQEFEILDISRELCARALAYYNLGRYVGGEGRTEWLLILMAMGYWSEADKFIKSGPPPAGDEVLWQAVSAYIHYDAGSLKAIARQHTEPIYAYLLGLIYRACNRHMEVVEVMESAYEERPECLQFLDFVSGGVKML